MPRRLPFAIGAMLLLAPQWAGAAPPYGWFLAGSDPGSYMIERDVNVTREGQASGRLASIDFEVVSRGAPRPGPTGFGTMMQSFEPGEYLGKRLRMTGFVKAKDVKQWSGLWLRVDAKGHETSFDNMQDRPIAGTSSWKRYEIVLDVPGEADNISFGILLEGPGTVWLSDVQFVVVDASVPTTGSGSAARRPHPVNLNFEK